MENKPKEPYFKSIIIMRHGERIDCVDAKSSQKLPEYDPELTDKGIKQAKDIGKQIEKCLKKEINTINLYSSPFTRTLMTGLNIVKDLNLNNNNIYLVNDLFEIASEKNFAHFLPLNHLLINYKNENNNYYKDGENQYNNYLNKVQEKIEKIEKFISDYQEKEENIFNNLNNLEEIKNDLGKSKVYNNISSDITEKNSDKNDSFNNENEKLSQ